MQSKAKTVDQYIEELPPDRKKIISELRNVVKKNLPKGFSEGMGYGMMGWSVPHSLYPLGYHCTPELPLPFMGIASQKNFVAVYHMGKSWLRFKKAEDVPVKLIGELASKMSPEEWIHCYESRLKPKKQK